MSIKAPKKTHKQKWDDVQRNVASREWADSKPYMRTRTTSHPYDPNNPSNPYALKPSSEKSTSLRQEQSSRDNDSIIRSG